MGYIIDDEITDEYVIIDFDEEDDEYIEVSSDELEKDPDEESEESEEDEESEEKDPPDTRPEGYSPDEIMGAYCDECQEYYERAKPNTAEGAYVCRDCKRSYRNRNRFGLDY